MKRFLLFISIVSPVFFFGEKAYTQQTVANGGSTTAINFPSNSCTYNWINDNPGIGLAAAGTGNIAAFTAVNTGNTPVTATIIATPMQSPGYAYITNSDDGTVSVINLLTQKIIAAPQVGKTPVYITVSPDNHTVYVSNFYGNSVSVIDVATNLVTGTIMVGSQPAGLAVSPDGTRLYVCNSSNVSVFSTDAAHKNLANIFIGEYPNSVAFSPDGNTAYVTNNYAVKNNVTIINTATGKVTGLLTAGTDPTGVLVNPDGKHVYVGNTYDNNISVFNTATNSLTAKIAVGSGPLGMALSPDGKTLYVTNSGDNGTSTLSPGSVSVINLVANKLITTIPLGGSTYPLGISVTPDGKQVYVVNDNTNKVSIINTSTYTIANNGIDVGQFPNSIGNFMAAPLCTGSPVTYTITVNPASNITASNISGSIAACQGSASAAPQQFIVSADRLLQPVTATAPANFEISLTANEGYGNSVNIAPDGGRINNVPVYVRSLASAPPGNISGNVVLSSPNTNDQDVAVAGVVNTAAVPAVFIAASGNDICTGTSVTFTATPYNGGISPDYQWLVNGKIAGTNSATFSSSTLDNGDAVTCSITSDAPCIAPASIGSNTITMNVISQLNVPSVSITVSDDPACAGSPVTFTATTVNGGNSPVYQWQVNGNNAGTNSATFTGNMFANGDVVTCMMTGNIACSAPAGVTSNQVIMNINATPVVNAGGNKTMIAGKGVVLNGSATGNITDITWSPAAGLSNYKILNPVASPSSTTAYALTVQTSDGCAGSDTATVQVTYPIIVPNTFTPNGDGKNDTWNIKYLDNYTDCKIQVFNRRGQLLYSSTGYGIPWDGTYKGEAVPSGTYYYVIDFSKNTKPLAGALNIIR